MFVSDVGVVVVNLDLLPVLFCSFSRALVYGEKNVAFKGPIMNQCGHVTEESKKFIRIDFDGLKEEGLLLKSRAGFEVKKC